MWYNEELRILHNLEFQTSGPDWYIISEIESRFFPQWLKKVPSPSDYVNIRTKWNILDHSANNVPAGWGRDRLYICGLYFPLISLCYNAKYYQISRWPEFLPWCHGNNLLLLHVKFEWWTIVLGFQWYVRRLRKLNYIIDVWTGTDFSYNTNIIY